MQAYNDSFSRVFNNEFSSFSKRVTPYLINYYEAHQGNLETTNVLDLCCGAGHLANGFLNKGYHVVGVDGSKGMVQCFIKNNSKYIEQGQAVIIEDDITNFRTDEQFGLVVSTYDSINHLENERVLNSCLNSVYKLLIEGGLFIFDLNTRLALLNWNKVCVTENEYLLMVSKGIYDGVGEKAVIRFSGFSKLTCDSYERFDQIIVNTVFKFDRVRAFMLKIGWKNVYFAKIDDLSIPVSDPEKENEENRIFIVAHK